MAEATVSSKNQIVIPKEAREALGTKPGDKLLIVVRNNSLLIMKKPVSYHKAIRGIAKGLYPPDYLKKERESWR